MGCAPLILRLRAFIWGFFLHFPYSFYSIASPIIHIYRQKYNFFVVCLLIRKVVGKYLGWLRDRTSWTLEISFVRKSTYIHAIAMQTIFKMKSKGYSPLWFKNHEVGFLIHLQLQFPILFFFFWSPMLWPW